MMTIRMTIKRMMNTFASGVKFMLSLVWWTVGSCCCCRRHRRRRRRTPQNVWLVESSHHLQVNELICRWSVWCVLTTRKELIIVGDFVIVVDIHRKTRKWCFRIYIDDVYDTWYLVLQGTVEPTRRIFYWPTEPGTVGSSRSYWMHTSSTKSRSPFFLFSSTKDRTIHQQLQQRQILS